MKTVFLNPELCIGCKQCEFACAVEHSRNKDTLLSIGEDPPPRTRIYVTPGTYTNFSIPNKCRHCNPAPCLNVCPTGAITRDEATDAVLIEGNKCIACAMCAMVCPFEAVHYHKVWDAPARKEVAVKCDNCVERQHNGMLPACVEACKVGALQFGDVNELVAKARTALAGRISVAVSSIRTDETSALPANIDAWRQWGKAIVGSVRRQEEDSHVHP